MVLVTGIIIVVTIQVTKPYHQNYGAGSTHYTREGVTNFIVQGLINPIQFLRLVHTHCICTHSMQCERCIYDIHTFIFSKVLAVCAHLIKDEQFQLVRICIHLVCAHCLAFSKTPSKDVHFPYALHFPSRTAEFEIVLCAAYTVNTQ